MTTGWKIAACALLALAATGSVAFADTMTIKADLKSATEVPPNDTGASGNVTGTYDTATKVMTYTITYSGLSGPATAAHFHSPADPGANAPPTVPLKGDLASPIKGTATLTDDAAKALADGKMYFNLHTAAHKGGETRGQVMLSK